jgi:hypothetical protein
MPSKPETRAKGQGSDLSLCATLLSLFDFNALGEVSKADWERGTTTLLLGELGKDDVLWTRLLGLYDPSGKGAIQLDRVRDILPIDPRISVLLQQLVHAVAGCREFMAAEKKKQTQQQEVKANRAVIDMRKRMMQPVFSGWCDAVRKDRKARIRSARFMRSQAIGRAWRSWRGLADASAAKHARMGVLMRRMVHRGVTRALMRWVAWWEERRGQQAALRRALSPLNRAWNQWKALSEQRAALRVVLRRGLGGGALSRAFNTWLAYLGGQSAQQASTRRIGAQLVGAPIARAFNTWRAARAGKREMARALRHLLQHGLAKAWRRWRGSLKDRGKMHACARRLLQRGVLRALNRWNALARERTDERRRLHVLTTARRAFSPLCKAWRVWLEHSERRRQLRALLGRGRSGGGLLHKAWSQWVAGMRVCACVCVGVLARSRWPPPPLSVCHRCLPPLLVTAACHRCLSPLLATAACHCLLPPLRLRLPPLRLRLPPHVRTGAGSQRRPCSPPSPHAPPPPPRPFLPTLVSRSAAAGDIAQSKQFLQRSAHAFKGGQLRAWHKWREVLEELPEAFACKCSPRRPPFPAGARGAARG